MTDESDWPLPDTFDARLGYLHGLAQGVRCQALPLAEAYGDTRAAAMLKETLADVERLAREIANLEEKHLRLMQLAAKPPTPAKH
jgi:hypothetical protein